MADNNVDRLRQLLGDLRTSSSPFNGSASTCMQIQQASPLQTSLSTRNDGILQAAVHWLVCWQGQPQPRVDDKSDPFRAPGKAWVHGRGRDAHRLAGAWASDQGTQGTGGIWATDGPCGACQRVVIQFHCMLNLERGKAGFVMAPNDDQLPLFSSYKALAALPRQLLGAAR